MGITLDTQLLRAFVAVAEVGSVTKAAKLLALTQSATSLQIQRLEELLDSELFLRSRRGVRLTAAGEAFLVYAKKLLALQDEAIRSVREVPDSARLRIGMPDVYAIRYLPEVLARFGELRPDVRPEIRCEVSTKLFDAVDEGACDVCLGVKHDREAVGEVLGKEPIAWVASPDLALAKDEPVPLALYPEFCIYRAHGLKALADAGRPWRIAYTSQSSSAIDIAVDCGWAVAIKSRRTAKPGWRELGEGDGMPPLEPVILELRRSPAADSPALRELCGLLAEAVRADLEGES